MASRTVLGLSVLFHGALGVLVYQIEKEEARAATAIEVAESKKKEEAPKPAPPPPPEPPKPSPRRAAAQEKPAETPPPEPAPLDALPDFGLELSGGVGGLAVAPAPEAGAAVPTKARPARATAQSVKRPAATAANDDCDEPPAKPKPRNIPQPAYTDAAREAGVEGKVRVELTVDETGRVASVRVIAGLGHGLDEAAVAAVRDATFEPVVRCGKPSRSTFTLGIRFSAS